MSFAKSDLRDWLDHDFYDAYFSKEEKEAVIVDRIRDPENGKEYETRVSLPEVNQSAGYLDPVMRHLVKGHLWLRPQEDSNQAAFCFEVFGKYPESRGGGQLARNVFPCIRMDFDSSFLKQRVTEDEDHNLWIKVTSLVLDGKRVRIGNPFMEEMEVPEGVRILESFSFYKLPALKRVSLPSTLEEVRAYGIGVLPSLEEIRCKSDTVSFDRMNFMEIPAGCRIDDLLYSKGSLPVSIDPWLAYSPEELARLWAYQQDPAWYDVLLKKINKDHAEAVLEEITRLLSEKTEGFEKAARRAVSFGKTYYRY